MSFCGIGNEEAPTTVWLPVVTPKGEPGLAHGSDPVLQELVLLRPRSPPLRGRLPHSGAHSSSPFRVHTEQVSSNASLFQTYFSLLLAPETRPTMGAERVTAFQ